MPLPVQVPLFQDYRDRKLLEREPRTLSRPPSTNRRPPPPAVDRTYVTLNLEPDEYRNANSPRGAFLSVEEAEKLSPSRPSPRKRVSPRGAGSPIGKKISDRIIYIPAKRKLRPVYYDAATRYVARLESRQSRASLFPRIRM